MITNKVKFGDDAFDAILKGCQVVADAVGSTHGPAGNNVIIDVQALYPRSTKDGVSVAQELFFLEDHWQRAGAQILINAAIKQLNDSGDGTTATIVIANEIIKEGIKHIKAGVNPTMFRKGLESATQDIVETLKKDSTPVLSDNDIEAVATIAANNNPVIGKLIAEAIIKVGEYGIVSHEKSFDGKDSVEYTTGYQWKKGAVLPYFYTNREKRRMEYDNPIIVVTDNCVLWAKDVMEFFEQVNEYNKEQGKIHPVIIIGEVKKEALTLIANNAASGKYPCAVIDVEGLYDERKHNLKDIATLCGAKLVTEEKGMRFKDTKIEHAGTCKKIVATQNHTEIIEGAGHTEGLQTHLKRLIKGTDSVEADYAKKRLARLTGGVAIIKAGGKTESEQNEVLDRIDDAIRATRSAQEEGIVIGGGFSYIQAKSRSNFEGNECEDFEKGRDTLMRAISAPTFNIFHNANIDYDEINHIANQNEGYDVLKRKKINNMFDYGIIDPLKVARTALENAVSVATLLLISKTIIITEKKIPKEALNS